MAWAWTENGHIFVAYSNDVAPEHAIEVDDNITPADLVLEEDGSLRMKTEQEKMQDIKSQMLGRLPIITKEYIERYYPETKQRSDVADKEYFETVLAMNNIDPQQIRVRIGQIVARHYNNFDQGLQELLSEYTDPTIQYALTQLLKVAYRVYFVQQVKQEYHQLVRSITDAESLDQLQSIQIELKTPFSLS